MVGSLNCLQGLQGEAEVIKPQEEVTVFDSIEIRFVYYLVIISNYVFLYYFIRLKLLLYFVKLSHLSVTMSVI